VPTTRTITFLSAAIVLYLFANQTQVGWSYVMSALLAGTILAAWWFSRGSLRGLSAERRIAQVEMHEEDMVLVSLSLRKLSGGGTSQLRVLETCPLAAFDSKERNLKLFIPSLPADGSVAFDYTVLVDRRGLYEFPPLALTSRAPFGFFQWKSALSLPTRALVYPEVRPLHSLDLLDRQVMPEVTRQRSGVGYEVMGVRPYRPGDSARYIHWRSVARRGELVSKEFADEAQPGLTLVLDLFAHSYPQTDHKHTPFEWMVKAAVSIAEYAHRKGYPLHVLADGDVLPVPNSPVSWVALLQYLARIQPLGKRPVDAIFGKQPTQAFVAAVLPWPDQRAIEPLLECRRRQADVLAVVLDPASFPVGELSAASFADQLVASGVETRLVRFGEDWTTQISAHDERVGAR
jgi:uncharacterized protein (DUF58 family)